MKRSLIVLLLLISAAALAQQQNFPGGAGTTITTVSGLNSVSGKTKGTIAVVLDGNSPTDCTTGGGTNVVVCQYSGATWAQMVAASSGATAFSAITGGTNTAVLLMGTGGSLGTSGTGTITATAMAVGGLTGLGSGVGTWLATPTATNLGTALGSQTANTFYAAPNGSSGNLAARAIVAADVPTLNQNTTGTSAGLSLPSGSTALGTTAIASGACATTITVAAAGLTTATGTLGAPTFVGDPTAVTGYGVSATGAVLTIYPFITTGNVNFRVCNSTANSITPGALTLNWQVTHL